MPEIWIVLGDYACDNDPDSCPAYAAGRLRRNDRKSM